VQALPVHKVLAATLGNFANGKAEIYFLLKDYKMNFL